MFWPSWKYEECVKKNASLADLRELLVPAAEPVDPKTPRVLVTYYPMPVWMEWFDLTIADESFKLFVHRYRSAVASYKDRLQKQFPPILSSSTGQALLAELARSGHVVRFRPYWNWLDPINADTQPRNVTHPDEEDYEDALAKDLRFRIHGKRLTGTGRGANSVIGYSPEMWGKGGSSKETGPSYEPDAMMFHEMVHASRQMKGKQDYMRVNRGYDNVEEYVAIVLTNIYMSEKGVTQLVAGHGDAPLRRPEKFLDNIDNIDYAPRALMRSLKDDQPEFYDDLSNITIGAFNPVRQHKQELQAGEALFNVMLGS